MVAAAIVVEAAQDGADELAGVLAIATLLGGEPHAQGEGEALEVFDPGFQQTIRVDIHSRADL